MKLHRPPFSPREARDFEALRGAMGLGQKLARGYVDPVRVIAIHRAWFEYLVGYCADGTHERLFGEELALRVQFVLRYESSANVEALLTDAHLLRAEAARADGGGAKLRVLRADIRRTRGAFRGALEDLEVARAQIEGDGKDRATEGRGAYEAVALKVSMDLGLLDRASKSLEQLGQLAAGKPARSFENQRYQLGMARYFQANGLHGGVVQTVGKMFPEGADPADLEFTLTDLEARALVLRALAMAKLADSPEQVRAAITTLRFERKRSGTDQASRVPLDIELARALQSTKIERDLEESYSIAVAVLDQLEDGRSSTLFTARAAAQVYGLVKGMGKPGEITRARAVLEDSGKQLVRSWREIGRFDGGIGFLDFPERLAVASAWISARLDSPGGAAHALQGLLEIDSCSQLSRRLAERCPDSPALTVEVTTLVSLARAHGSHLVWFLPTPDRTHRFTVTGDGVQYASLKPLDAFQARFGRALRWLRQRPPEGTSGAPGPRLEADLRWLSAELLPAPFSSRASDPERAAPVGRPSLWLSGLDAFGYAPFELLPGPSGEPLGLTVPLVRLPSLTCAVHEALAAKGTGSNGTGPNGTGPNGTGPKEQAKGSFTVFSPPMGHHPSGNISLTTPEIMALREATLESARFNIIRGPTASRDGFAQAVGTGAELFVAWTHGKYDQDLKRPAGLVAAGPGGEGFDFLDADFVDGALQRAGREGIPRAVYLAACDVARGHRRLGDAAASHLGGAFLGAGVPMVVASSERNDRDATAAHLMAFSQAFLGSEIGQGLSAERSMLKARNDVAGVKGWAHPHFWAGLQLLGWGPTASKR